MASVTRALQFACVGAAEWVMHLHSCLCCAGLFTQALRFRAFHVCETSCINEHAYANDSDTALDRKPRHGRAAVCKHQPCAQAAYAKSIARTKRSITDSSDCAASCTAIEAQQGTMLDAHNSGCNAPCHRGSCRWDKAYMHMCRPLDARLPQWIRPTTGALKFPAECEHAVTSMNVSGSPGKLALSQGYV